jgi:predicted ester cyclase
MSKQLGIPATNKYFSIGAHDIHRIANERIVESWHVEDWLSALVQLGAFGS